MLTAATIASAGLLITACVPSEPVVTPVETGTIKPIFASDEEALAAAVEAYEGYQRVSYEVGGEDSSGYEPLRLLLTEEWYKTEVAGFERFAEDGIRLAGFASISEFALQQWWEEPQGVANVIVYICEDLTNARIVDGGGADLTPSDRENIVPIEVTFVSAASRSTELLIARVLPWNGSGLCS